MVGRAFDTPLKDDPPPFEGATCPLKSLSPPIETSFDPPPCKFFYLNETTFGHYVPMQSELCVFGVEYII